LTVDEMKSLRAENAISVYEAWEVAREHYLMLKEEPDYRNPPNPAFDAMVDARASRCRRSRTSTGERVPAAKNFVTTDEIELGKGSVGQKYCDNVAAISVVASVCRPRVRAWPGRNECRARQNGLTRRGGLPPAYRGLRV
jgi:hypothetical protein